MNQPAPHATTPATPARERKPLPQAIPAATMRLARMRGEVEPFSPQFPHYVRFRGHWWVNDGTEWIRLAAPEIVAAFDRLKANSSARFERLRNGEVAAKE